MNVSQVKTAAVSFGPTFGKIIPTSGHTVRPADISQADVRSWLQLYAG